jgi:alkylation response protein AidB-like acyl-CoA dehydrogenase
MSIGISDEHVELAKSLRQWAAECGGLEAVRAAESEPDATFADVWKQAVEMGVATIGLPEAAGGGGGSVLDAAVALEACAHELVPGPLLGVAVASALLGETDGIAEALGDGAVVGLALDPALRTVWDVPSATHFLVPNADDDWFVVPADDLTTSASIGLDLSRRFGSVEVDLSAPGVVPVAWLEGELVHRAVVTYAAAEAAGIARWALRTAVEYAKVREQFGQKIGAFQAIKHLCAEMLETAEAVTAAAWDVASTAFATEDGGDDQWAFAADVAAVTCFDGAVDNAKSCIQVLGGIGFTYEHDAHLYLRRALSLRALVEDSDVAAERLTDRAVAGVRRRVHVDLEGRD